MAYVQPPSTPITPVEVVGKWSIFMGTVSRVVEWTRRPITAAPTGAEEAADPATRAASCSRGPSATATTCSRGPLATATTAPVPGRPALGTAPTYRAPAALCCILDGGLQHGVGVGVLPFLFVLHREPDTVADHEHVAVKQRVKVAEGRTAAAVWLDTCMAVALGNLQNRPRDVQMQ
eukprot:m.375914 g.375914  ORF g.375914 m.375914 type:complete len:177 (-) comp28188_c3_seq3:3422-3952(-)